MPSYWTTELRNVDNDFLVASTIHKRTNSVGEIMEPKPSKFWMVLGAGVPVYRHTTLESAKAEAERLSRLHRGHEFTVLEAVATCRSSDVSWTDLNQEKQGIPF